MLSSKILKDLTGGVCFCGVFFVCVCVLRGVQCSKLFFTLEHISLFSILSFTNVLLNHLKYSLCYVHEDLYDISLMDQWMICEMSRQSRSH